MSSPDEPANLSARNRASPLARLQALIPVLFFIALGWVGSWLYGVYIREVEINKRREYAKHVRGKLWSELTQRESAYTNVSIVYSVMGSILRPSEVFMVYGTVPSTNDLHFLMEKLLKEQPPGNLSFSVWVDSPKLQIAPAEPVRPIPSTEQ